MNQQAKRRNLQPPKSESAAPEQQTTALAQAALLLTGAKSLLVFTGAGASQESGIETFRDNIGLWKRFPPDRFATLSGLTSVAVRNPRALAQFFTAVFAPIARAKPNPAHLAISTLSQFRQVDVVTQNVDGLHQEAGSNRVLEIHGSLLKRREANGKISPPIQRETLLKIVTALRKVQSSRLPRLRIHQAMRPLFSFGLGQPHWSPQYRPTVVLFGEALHEPDWTQAIRAAQKCDAMLVVGTSGVVYPAAELPERVMARGRPVVGVGLEVGAADLWLTGKAGSILPKLVSALDDRKTC